MLNRQRHGQIVNQLDEEWKGFRAVSCSVRNGKGSWHFDLFTQLVNQSAVVFISVEWELSAIVNFYKEKGDSLERENYRGLKLTGVILNISETRGGP